MHHNPIKSFHMHTLFSNTTSVVRSLAEDKDGGLWLGTDLDGVLQVVDSGQLPDGLLPAHRLLRFGMARGCPRTKKTRSSSWKTKC